MAKGRGFSTDSRVRERQEKMLQVYAEHAPVIGGDKDKDKAAMIEAVDRSGIDLRLTKPEAKIRKFMRLWKSDESRAYLCELWGMTVTAEPDPVSLAMKMLHEHMVQEDESWGPKDRAVSLSATKEAIKVFIPAQTTKIASLNVSAKIDRPEEFNQEPVMQSRTILPAGQKIAKPTGPTGGDEDDDEDDE